MAKSDVDADTVRKLAALLEETGLTEIEVARGDWRVRVARAANGPAGRPQPTEIGLPQRVAPPASAGPITAEAIEQALATHPGTVTSPMVGTVYLAPSAGAEPFVKQGGTVKEGDTLLLIEAMKTFNEVRAPRPGTVERILVEDGAPVEFAEPLLILA